LGVLLLLLTAVEGGTDAEVQVDVELGLRATVLKDFLGNLVRKFFQIASANPSNTVFKVSYEDLYT
jgi:hypothetical protein